MVDDLTPDDGAEREVPALSWQRLLTAIVGWPTLFAVVLFAPSAAFTTVVILSSMITAWELVSLLEAKEGSPLIAALLSGLVTGAFITPDHSFLISLVASAFSLGILCALVRSQRCPERVVRDASVITLALGYVGLPLGFLVVIRQLPEGIPWVVTVLGVTWARDVGAFVGGHIAPSAHAMLPSISPRKTLFGSLAGIAGATTAIFMLVTTGVITMSVGQMSALVVATGFLGQCGDLFESAIKRSVGARHSGIVLPGQGGVLDTVDGFLLLTPLAYAIALC